MTQRAQQILSTYVINALIILVGIAVVASIVAPIVPQSDQWVVFDEDRLNAVWDADSQTVLMTAQVTRQRDCRRVPTSVFLRPIARDNVETIAIEMRSVLGDRIRDAPLGQSAELLPTRLFPLGDVGNGHYLLSIAAYCELPTPDLPEGSPTPAVPPTPTTLRAGPVQLLIVVSEAVAVDKPQVPPRRAANGDVE